MSDRSIAPTGRKFPARLLGDTNTDIYQSTVDYLLTFTIFESWREMKTILPRAASK